ncbi:hypothetical protein AB0F72_09760 [Actinoplanes sp. NPDC023936]|uniref:hypothetical protein n=1 Tax=Actinoplanes sp. NPDC023936 TaxID=3154910 RepID=UPI0033C839F0
MEDGRQIVAGIRGQSWVDGTLGGVGVSLDVQQQRAGEHFHRPLKALEDEAYASEIPALERYRRNQP